MADPPEDAPYEIAEEPPSTPVEGEDEESENEEGGSDSANADGGDELEGREHNNAKTKAEAAAPQARMEAAPPDRLPSGGSDGELVDCKLTPVDMQNQRKNLKDVLLNDAPATNPPPLNGEHGGGARHHVQFAEERNNNNNNNPPVHQHQSALHRDEYAHQHQHQHHDERKQHNPRHHESALGASSSKDADAGKLGNPFARRKKSRLAGGEGSGKSQSHGRHSHPRRSPYKSEVARLRHAQQLERERRRSSKDPPDADDGSNASTAASGKSITLKDTTAPPETAFFSVQSAKFKHSLLHSLGEFLTSAFADDEEESGSYFSQDLLDQLGDSDPRLRGVWLQAKSLTDDNVRQLCEALIRNKVVTEVWLPSNRITDEGAAHIAHMLKFNKSIKELFLGQNEIGPKGAAALAGALARGNSTLVALGLGDNRIGVEGAGAFAAALRHNHSLHTLDVKNNGIPRRSSIRGLLQKMLEFNASDPGDESLVLGLQEELAGLVAELPPEEAEEVVMRAEEALKTAMLCRKRGDRVGAAEAEGAFIRICTTGEPPVDPPEEMTGEGGGGGGGRGGGGGQRKVLTRKKRRGDLQKKEEHEHHGAILPDRAEELNAELSSLKFDHGDEEVRSSTKEEEEGGGGGDGDDPEEEGGDEARKGEGDARSKEESQANDEGEGGGETAGGTTAEESASGKRSDNVKI